MLALMLTPTDCSISDGQLVFVANDSLVSPLSRDTVLLVFIACLVYVHLLYTCGWGEPVHGAAAVAVVVATVAVCSVCVFDILGSSPAGCL